MKLIQIIKQFMKRKDIVVSQAHMMGLENRILRDLPIRHTSMEQTKQALNPFSRFKPHVTTVFAFSLLFIVILGTLGFTKIKLDTTNQAQLPTLMKPVSAEELIKQAEKAIGKRFYYKKVSWVICSTDPKDYEQFFRNEGGQYEENLSVRKQMSECIKNDGKLFNTQKVWVDNDQNIVRIEDKLAEWQVPDGFKDKKGRERMEEVTPVRIRKGDIIYKFHAIGEKTNTKGLREGLYVEEKLKNIQWEDREFKYAKQTAEETFNDILASYKDPQKGKVVFEESEGHYKLNLLLPKGKDTLSATESQEKEYYLFSTQLFDKKTLKPFKHIQYNLNATEPERIISETTYEEFATDFNESIFDLNKAPEGYIFAKGAPSSFDIDIRCEACKWGDTLTYTIIPHTYKNAEGKEVQYPSNFYNGKVILPISLKVYESQERFETKEEAEKAKNLTFYELKKTQEKTAEWIENDLFFKSKAKIGEKKRYSQVKVVAFDLSGKKLGENISISILPFAGVKLPNSGNLSFMYVTALYIDENTTHSEAFYRWKNNTKDEITVAFQKPDNMSEKKAFACKGYRSSSEYEKILCEVTTEDDITKIRVGSEFTGKDNKKVSTWWRTDLYYKHIFVTIQFNKGSTKCKEGAEDDHKVTTPNVERIQCIDNVILPAEKEQILQETKQLIKKLAEEWK